VVDLGSVDDAEREWLFGAARAVLVPSVIEGFGLVPLEAARAKRPCLFAAVSSLSEVVSPDLATLEPWDPSVSAARVAPLLRDGPARDAHVSQLRADADRWRWDELAARVLDSYARTLRTPYRAAADRAWQELERERYLVELHDEYQDLRRRLGDRMALATEDGFLTPNEQRGLLRIGSRPALARAVLWPFAMLGAIRHGPPRRDTDR
jgi:glycosyltransferase involved in cell wall biosynthesis